MTHTKRCAIVGTAGSWKKTPWSDPTLHVWSLNDAYSLGLPRADRWFDQHPFQKMWFRPRDRRLVYANEVPEGAYVRPEGHIEWLKQQAATIPVYLKDAPPAGWPANAQRFPIERITQEFGSEYWASGPAYMLALAMLEGYTEIHVYGIHLSTEHEYRQQRPNWEFLLGRFLGLRYTLTEKDGCRIYDGENGHRIVLPTECPILTHGWRYGYEPKPLESPFKVELKHLAAQKARVVETLVSWPRWRSKAPQLDRLRRLTAKEQDVTMRWQAQQHREMR